MNRKEAALEALYDTLGVLLSILFVGIVATLFLVVPSILFGVPGLCIGAVVMVFVVVGVDRYLDYRDPTNPR